MKKEVFRQYAWLSLAIARERSAHVRKHDNSPYEPMPLLDSRYRASLAMAGTGKEGKVASHDAAVTGSMDTDQFPSWASNPPSTPSTPIPQYHSPRRMRPSTDALPDDVSSGEMRDESRESLVERIMRLEAIEKKYVYLTHRLGDMDFLCDKNIEERDRLLDEMTARIAVLEVENRHLRDSYRTIQAPLDQLNVTPPRFGMKSKRGRRRGPLYTNEDLATGGGRYDSSGSLATDSDKWTNSSQMRDSLKHLKKKYMRNMQELQELTSSSLDSGLSQEVLHVGSDSWRDKKNADPDITGSSDRFFEQSPTLDDKTRSTQASIGHEWSLEEESKNEGKGREDNVQSDVQVALQEKRIEVESLRMQLEKVNDEGVKNSEYLKKMKSEFQDLEKQRSKDLRQLQLYRKKIGDLQKREETQKHLVVVQDKEIKQLNRKIVQLSQVEYKLRKMFMHLVPDKEFELHSASAVKTESPDSPDLQSDNVYPSNISHFVDIIAEQIKEVKHSVEMKDRETQKYQAQLKEEQDKNMLLTQQKTGLTQRLRRTQELLEEARERIIKLSTERSQFLQGRSTAVDASRMALERQIRAEMAMWEKIRTTSETLLRENRAT